MLLEQMLLKTAPPPMASVCGPRPKTAREALVESCSEPAGAAVAAEAEAEVDDVRGGRSKTRRNCPKRR